MAQHLKAAPAGLRPPSPHLSVTPPPQKEYGIENLSVCASPGDFAAPPSKRKGSKSENESLAAALQKFCVNHQLGLALNFILFLGLTYLLFPSLRPTTEAFFTLSYRQPSGQYVQGLRDLYLVGGFVIYFTASRAFLMDYILTPLAEACGIKKRKAKTRFIEQMHQILYYLVYWSWGMYLFIEDTPGYVEDVNGLLLSLWREFPRLTVSPGMKLYYLTQLAFWLQQILVLHLEARRKDHLQMLSHHIITVGLMVFSHGYRQWRVGNAILVLMDIVDLVFSTAKVLRYLGLQTACDCCFGLFVVTWILTRHIGYGLVCWSIYAQVSKSTMFYGKYRISDGQWLSYNGGDKVLENLFQPFLNPDATTVSFNYQIRGWFLDLLLALQGITIVWMYMIIRVVIRVLKGQGADDSRSDDEEDDGEEEDIEEGVSQPSAPITSVTELQKPRFIEVETSSEEVTWPTAAWPSSSSSGISRKKSKGISSGLNLGEHKDILNRIGCLSEEQLAREREKREGSSSPRPRSSNGGGKKK